MTDDDHDRDQPYLGKRVRVDRGNDPGWFEGTVVDVTETAYGWSMLVEAHQSETSKVQPGRVYSVGHTADWNPAHD